jgi:hypothetical protein
VDPRASLDTVEKRKIPSLCRESNPGHPARSLVAIPTETVVNRDTVNYSEQSVPHSEVQQVPLCNQLVLLEQEICI